MLVEKCRGQKLHDPYIIQVATQNVKLVFLSIKTLKPTQFWKQQVLHSFW